MLLKHFGGVRVPKCLQRLALVYIRVSIDSYTFVCNFPGTFLQTNV